MKFKIKPYQHQLDAIKLAVNDPNRALFWEMGTGKTGGIINILRMRYGVEKRLMKTLILSPQVTLYNWKNEFEMHSNIKEDQIIVLSKSGKARVKMFEDYLYDHGTMRLSKERIILTNYEALISKDLMEVIKEWEPEVLVCDESHYVKNYKSKRSKAVAILADKARFKYILTGTPILNSPMDIFMQYRILDGGETFGKNFFTFRGKYFEDKNRNWAGKNGYYPKWEPRVESFEDLHTKMFAKATRVLKDECLDLPDLIKQRVYVELSPQQRKVYNEMKKDFLTYVKGLKKTDKPKAVVAQLAVTKALRLQQILTGYVTAEDGTEVELGTIPRLDVVKELLQELTPNHKVILWCSFRKNYEQLAQVCKNLGVNYVTITGELNAKQKQESVDSFEKQADVRVCIANRRAGGIGINLVAASYSIVYSRNFSLGEEQQSEARNHRGGSERHARIVKIDLCTKGTLDETVLEALNKKQQLSDSIVDFTKEDL